MLPEDFIIKVSLIAIISGLFGLYIISNLIEPEFVNIKEINESFVGKVIKTNGTVSNVFLSNSSTLFLNLKENKDIPIIMFNIKENKLAKSDKVVIRGEVTLYKGKLELVAKKIKKQKV